MGGGAWTTTAYTNYVTTTAGFSNMDDMRAADVSQLYRVRSLDSVLSPYNIMRECVDSEEHPNTIPVILALDVTGSMGGAAEAVAKQLGDIMEDLYQKITDVEFCIMAIGDLSYDGAPIQMGQFESDVRIADQLGKVYFESGGGGNKFESYTAAWYMGARHTKLDCWNRGKKGIIITLGDEPLNPFLPARPLTIATGDPLQGDINTVDLLAEVQEKYHLYHIVVDDSRTSARMYEGEIANSWESALGKDRVIWANCNQLGGVITNIITSAGGKDDVEHSVYGSSNDGDGIYW